MLSDAVSAFLHFLDAVGGWGLALGMALESAGFPLPSEVLLPFAGYLVWDGRMGIAEALAYATFGQLAGSAAAYFVGRFGGRPLILKYHRRLLIKESHLMAAEAWFARYSDKAVLIARLFPVVRSVISYPAGVSRMGFARFLGYSFVGVLPFTWALTFAGFKLGQNWMAVRDWFHRFDYALAGLAAVILSALACRYRWRRKAAGRV